MTRNKLNKLYFDWMCQLVSEGHYSNSSEYMKLLTFLDNVDFFYTIDTDGNRESDGVSLRYRFGYENDYDDVLITKYLDNKPCSVLEMMVALANRCEEHIMDNPDIGDRTGEWFWTMIDSLGLSHMTDSNYDKDYTGMIIEKFLNREYECNGKGGLFTLQHCRYDLRTVEIWYQMCWYLNEII